MFTSKPFMTMGTGAMLELMSELARVPLLMVQSSPMTR